MYKKGMEEGNKAMVEDIEPSRKNTTGYVEPYPLRLPSDIRKVWMVDHPNEAGDLIQGHWVFMVVTPGQSAYNPPVHPDNGERTSARSLLSKISPLLQGPAPRARSMLLENQ